MLIFIVHSRQGEDVKGNARRDQISAAVSKSLRRVMLNGEPMVRTNDERDMRV